MKLPTRRWSVNFLHVRSTSFVAQHNGGVESIELICGHRCWFGPAPCAGRYRCRFLHAQSRRRIRVR
jgi:hypothetical protein